MDTIEYVEDWEERIANYDEDRKKMVRIARDKMELFMDSINHPDWKEYVDDTKEKVLIETRTSAAGLSCVKGSGIAPYPIDQCFTVIGDSENYRRKYDKNYDTSHIMKKVGH